MLRAWLGRTACCNAPRRGGIIPQRRSRPRAGSGHRRLLYPGVGGERARLVRRLPGELRLVAPEVPLRRGLLVDLAQQVEQLGDCLLEAVVMSPFERR